MTTPIRPIPDFDMNSARRDPPSAIPKSSADVSGFPSQLPPGGSLATAGSREMEQRFARLVAESEYKLLEERGRAHEREAKLREELARERAQIPKLVQERVEKREKELQAAYEAKVSSSSAGTTVGGKQSSGAAAAEIDSLKQQLKETQSLLTDAERRYQQEKRELLNLRTAQLKNETSKRGQEGDIVGRAMQVMSEYETIIRSSEENSLARLAHHMENFEKEWIRRSREFEERKSEFEAHIMTKALEALQMHNQDVDAIGHHIVDKTLELLRSQGEARLQLEEEVMHHSEQFKLQYKEMLEAEFRERCRVYDEKIADRERNLTKILEHERQRIIAVEQEAIANHEALHVQALTEAMTDISKLREQVVREHQEQQAKSIQDLVARRNEMRDEQAKLIEQANERVREVERQCFEAVDSAQRALKEMQVHLIHKEAELTKQLMDVSTEKEQQRLKDIAAVREECQSQSKEIIEELRSQHLYEIEKLTSDYQQRIDREHNEQFLREAELRKLYEQRMVKVEEASDQRWATRVSESSRALDRHLEVIQALRDDNEQLTAQLASLQQQFLLREQEMGQKVNQIQREHEAVWHRKMEEMRARYDQLLDEALGGPQGESVPRAEHEKVLEQVRELEERAVQIKQQESQRSQHERDHLNELWKARLEEERSDRAIWEQEQMNRLADLRVEVYADARRKETEFLRRGEQERLRLHEEAMGRTLEERKDRDAFEDRVRLEAETRIREAEEELNEAFHDKVRIAERRVEEREAAVERRRLDLKREYAAMEEASKKQAAEWLEKEKKEILADVKKFHEKLVEEQQRIEAERSTFEQRLSMQYAEEFEQAKASLHLHMATVTRNHMDYWAQCEQKWLQNRGEEMKILFEQRLEHEQLIKAQAQNIVHLAREEARGMLKAERAALDARQAEMFTEMEKNRMELETTARERALKLLEERNKLQEETEIRRAEEEARIWEQLERRVLEKERSAESERRVLELELRNRYESLMNSERHRLDALMEQHRKEAGELYDRQQQALRLRDEEWHRQRLHVEAEERLSHERMYQDIREQADQRVQEERKRLEMALRSREQEFDAERMRGLDALEKQLRDHEASTRRQLQLLSEDYDRRVRMLTQDMHHQREEYIADIAEQERKAQALREEYEQVAMAKFEKNLKELRAIMEKRQREQQTRELEARDELEKQRREFEEKLNKQYEDLLKSHEERLIQMQEKREAQALHLEKEHQEHLLAVRSDMEKTLASYFAQADVKAKEMAESTKTQFETKLEEYYNLVAQERRKRVDAEAAFAASVDEKEALRLSMEQYKLEVQRSIQSKYEKLFAEVREKTRQEKEDQARRMLEEEEKKLASEILRRDQEKRHDWQAAPQQQHTTTSHSMASMSGIGGGYAAAAAKRSAHNLSTLNHDFGIGATPFRAGLHEGPASGSLHTPGASRAVPESSALQATPAVAAAEDPFVETLQRRKDKLTQLWQVLDVPEAEKNAFLDSLVGTQPHQALDIVSSEVRKLESQLPLLEVITRREFVQHRLRELEKKPGTMPQQQSDELVKELIRLTEYLKLEIPKYESKQGQKFSFRGRRYMDVLLTEAEQEARAMTQRSGIGAAMRTA